MYITGAGCIEHLGHVVGDVDTHEAFVLTELAVNL